MGFALNFALFIGFGRESAPKDRPRSDKNITNIRLLEITIAKPKDSRNYRDLQPNNVRINLVSTGLSQFRTFGKILNG